MTKPLAENELFYYHLFSRLQGANFSVGIGEYLLFLEAIQTQVYPLEPAALKELCQTLWVKSVEQQRLFEVIYRELMVTTRLQDEVVVLPEKQIASEPGETVPQPDAETVTQPTISEATEDYLYFPPAPTNAVNLTPDVEVVKAVRTSQPRDWLAFRSSGQKNEYLPVSAQQMLQGWYTLKRPIQEGVKRELDIAATIEAIKQRGKTAPPVLKPRTLKHSPLLLLIDHRGSMQPFHVLSRQLVMTARQAGCLEKEACYYFDNYPEDTLYGDPEFDAEIPVTEVLTKLNPEWTVVLIFSDGGATNGDYNRKRLRQTQSFLAQLQPRVKAMVWLNPLPKERWERWWERKTTTGEIARLKSIKMVSADYAGWQQAMQVLQ